MGFKYLKAGLASLILSSSCLVNTANAGLIVDNGFDISASNGLDFSNDGIFARTWDDFTLSNDIILTSASFLFRNSSNSYSFDILADNAGTLGTSVFSLTMAANEVSVADVGLGFNRFDFALPSIELSAGAYWVSFTNDAPNGLLYGTKFGSYGAAMKQQFFTPGGGTGTNPNNYIPFQLNGSSSNIPEPSTLAIFALGMIGLASRRFKKQF